MVDNKIDVLLMTDNNINTVGGEQESTKIILNGVKENIDVGVLQPGKMDSYNPSIHYYELSNKTRLKQIVKNPFAFLKYINDVKKIINNNVPKIIHTQSQVSFFIVALLKKTKQISKEQLLIHTERGLYTKYNKFFKKLFIFFMEELNVLVTTTHFNQKYWELALTRQDIKLEYNVIENTAGEIYETLDEDLLKVDKGYFSIGFSGRYTDWKNWPLAVEISKQLNNRLGEKLHVNMTVGCLDRQAEINTEKMFENMHNLLGGRFKGKINVEKETMNKFYYDLDVFILTSNKNTESFGRTLVEAMSRMTAVLTTNAGGSVEVVGDANKVFNTANEFSKKIMQYYENKDLLREEKLYNLNRVKENYSLENNLNKHKKLYKQYINHGGN